MADHTDVLLPGEVLILRTCNADLTSKSDEARGFRWPESGAVACKDWDPSSRCGGGLHGLLWGCGDGSLLDWSDTAKGLAVAVPGDTVVGIDKRDDGFAKVKFPAGRVLFVGSLSDACKFIFERVPDAIKAAMVSGAASATRDSGAASATGYSGAVRGSLTSTLTLRRWDGKRYRIVALYPGEDGIKPLVWYRLNENGQPEEVPAEQCPKFATEPTNG